MFVKFTKKDGSPVWINAGYVVTVEPMRQGGSIVVPIGDGLDYEVSESPEDVVAAVGEAQGAFALVPVQNADPLSGTKRKRAARKKEVKPPAPADEAKPSGTAPAAKPAGAGIQRRQAPAPEAEAATALAAPAFVTAVPDRPGLEAPAPVLDLDSDAIDRLRAMAPRTVKKIANSLKAQFDVKSPDATIEALAASGIISIGEHGRVSWLTVASSSSAEVSTPSTTGTSA